MRPLKYSSGILFLLSIGLLCFGTAWAQQQAKEAKEAKQEGGKILDVKKLPPAVQKTVEEQTKGAKIVGLSKEVEDGKTQYELETTVNGRTRDMLIDPNGKLIKVETQVDIATLPAAVQAEVKKSLGEGKVLHFESVTKEGKLTGYEASVQRAGKRVGVSMGPDGKLPPPKPKK
ncbi:MAG TPA: PepSY domain-containing protein [Acidobacteriota bacterium]|nr:PepSY domain-containing protein [Acidobacteriota bacterium]